MADNRKISMMKAKGCPFCGQPFRIKTRAYEFSASEEFVKNYNKKTAVCIIQKAAKEYDKKLKGKDFLIIYRKTDTIITCCVGFKAGNFLHLTGVRTEMHAVPFYTACLNGKLSENDIQLDSKGKVQQKLFVLPYLSELLYNNCMIGDFIRSGVLIKADYFVGDTKAVISVGFRTGSKMDYPVTLYHGDIRNLTRPACKVLAIFRKDHGQTKYDYCTFLSKGYEVKLLPQEIKEKLDETLK